MIDTINLKLYDLRKHYEITNFLNNQDTEGRVMKLQTIPENEILDTRKKILHKKIYRFLENGKETDIKFFNALKSSNYDVMYQIDFYNDCIKFNISLPKYLFGHNLKMLCYHHNNKAFNPLQYNTIKGVFSTSYELLIQSIEKFFNKEFPDFRIYYDYLQIERIDFCYNQIFNNEFDCKTYLSELQNFKKKHIRENYSANPLTFGIFFKTQMYSFKIYHKGTEFDKTTKKEMLKKGFDKNKVEKISKIAHRTLRYELTCRNQFISYVNLKLQRKKNELFDKYIKFNQQLDYKSSTPAAIEKKRKIQIYFQKGNRKFFSRLARELENRTEKFYIESEYQFLWNQYEELNQSGEYLTDTKFIKQPLKYSKDLHFSLVDEFIKLYNDFQLDFYSNLSDEIAIIKNRKDMSVQLRERYPEISINKLSAILRLLQVYNFDELKKNNLIPLRTLYRYRKFVKQAFNKDLKVIQNNSIHIPTSTEIYFREMLENSI